MSDRSQSSTSGVGLWMCLCFVCLNDIHAAESDDVLRLRPNRIQLRGNFARIQLVATREADDKILEDWTHIARYESSDERVFVVDKNGVLRAISNGSARLQVSVASHAKVVSVTVDGVKDGPAVGFDTDVRPILSKAGCNMGACHASQYGKGGFKLSVFGFDPSQDHFGVVRDRLGRRVDFVDPANSLLLQKPTLQVAHGGGLRLRENSDDYQILLQWLAQRAPGPSPKSPAVEAISVTPAQRVAQLDSTQQLRVVATYDDGSTRDVTAWTKFDSMDDGVLHVSDTGRVTAAGRGQAPVMARFEGQAEISMFAVPYGSSVELVDWTDHNFIDELAARKFRELGIEPSPICSDATFVRRAFLDAIGTLPTAEQTVSFIRSEDSNKRTRLVDRLLGLTGNPELDVFNEAYSAYWTLKWSDLIRNTSRKLGEQGMWALHNWIRESFRENKAFDQFVAELITGTGSIYSNGPANYYRINQNSADLAESTSQLFLGIRLECAKCHHHPFETYGQDDYYGFAAFFARVGTKRSEEFGLFGREQVVLVKPTGEVRNPRTGQQMQPRPLQGTPVDHPLDRRIALAEWLTARDNAYFAKAVVNRYVGYLLGHGLVDPVDDLRSTNPPTNVALMEALAADFVDSDFDLKHLIRTIMTSRLYQLDSQPTAGNRNDQRFFSHFQVRRLPAEVLLDAIDQVTGVQTKFRNLPSGTRAIDLPDAEYPNYFLNTFAKPRRASVCECERPAEESLSQALHTLNGETLAEKIAHKEGRLGKVLADEPPHERIVEQLYLLTLSRFPSVEESVAAREFLQESPSSREFYEDLLWALINSKQFMFVR